jgi:uncharacterized protein (DUF362 family)
MRRSNRREFLRRAGSLAASTGLGAAFLTGCGKTPKDAEGTATADSGGSGSSGGAARRSGGGDDRMSGPGKDGQPAETGTEERKPDEKPTGEKQQPASAPAGRVVVSKGSNSPAALVRAAVEALGGMGAFVQKGQNVCLKPNASWPRVPGSGATTHPEVLKEVIRMCKEAGAREVIALDYTLSSQPLMWNELDVAAEEAGGRFIELRESDKDMFEEVDFVPGLKALPGIGPLERVAFDAIQADVFINMPVLKTHSATGLSIGLKNLMGAIYDRRRYHGGGSGGLSDSDVVSKKSSVLDQAIADLGLLFRDRVGLTIVDASYIMRSDSGPQGREEEDGDPVMQVVAGTDMVACDAEAARIFGFDDRQIRQKAPHIALAADLGYGTMDTKALAQYEQVSA